MARLGKLFISLAVSLVIPTSAQAGSSIALINLDGLGEGLNDPSSFAPVGGNSAVTLGEARRQSLEFAFSLWAQTLESDVDISIAVRFDPRGGTENSALLGTAGPDDTFRDFVGAPLPGVWYPSALASKLAGLDMTAGTAPAISAVFNSDVDGPVALGEARFYYGFDDHPPAGDINFIEVASHELAHGLGFVTFADISTGEKLFGYDDAYLLHLEHHGAVPSSASAMTDTQRRDAFRAGPVLHWVGPAVAAAAAQLTSGASPEGHVSLYAPPTINASSVEHFDPSLAPDEIVEPLYVRHDGSFDLTLTRAVLADIGWGDAAACETSSP